MCVLGRVGVVPPPLVVNALSVEPTKPRLILSMRALNLFCGDTPFSLTPLSDIIKSVQPKVFSPLSMMCKATSRLLFLKSLISFVASSGGAGGLQTPVSPLGGRTLPTFTPLLEMFCQHGWMIVGYTLNFGLTIVFWALPPPCVITFEH